MKLLICGTRGRFKDYKRQVKKKLDLIKKSMIIEGCCKNSADEYAEEWARENKFPIKHFPANSGNYLKRNKEMVSECDAVLAFWDEWSYGTAHTIANAYLRNKPIEIVKIEK